MCWESGAKEPMWEATPVGAAAQETTCYWQEVPERIVSCEGGHWLVDDAERDRRMKAGKTSYPVVALVRRGKEVDRPFRSGMWLAGRWCSIRRFLAVKLVRKVDRWRQVKVALDANWRRVEKVFGLVEAFTGDEGIEVESTALEEGERIVELGENKGKGKEAETPRKEEKEEKVDFSYVPKGCGLWFGESSARKDSKADLDWAVGLGKLKEVGVRDMGY